MMVASHSELPRRFSHAIASQKRVGTNVPMVVNPEIVPK